MRVSLLAALTFAAALFGGARTASAAELDVSKGTVQINGTGMYVYNTAASQFEPYSIRGMGQTHQHDAPRVTA